MVIVCMGTVNGRRGCLFYLHITSWGFDPTLQSKKMDVSVRSSVSVTQEKSNHPDLCESLNSTGKMSILALNTVIFPCLKTLLKQTSFDVNWWHLTVIHQSSCESWQTGEWLQNQSAFTTLNHFRMMIAEYKCYIFN